MPKTRIVRETQIALAPSDGKVGGLEAMRVSLSAPYITYLDSKAHHYACVHSHSEPEIMIVVAGRMIFNGAWCGVGSVIHVPANEDYWYATGDERCMVVLTRCGERGSITFSREEHAYEAERDEDVHRAVSSMTVDCPLRTKLKAGKRIYWCSCGISAKQPYCDGSHKGTVFKPMAHTEEIDITIALCGCKKTRCPPYCDGSHVDHRRELAQKADKP